MIGMLSGNESTVNAIKASIGKTIESVTLNNNSLNFRFKDSKESLAVWDDGQSCCESRYMVCADNLKEFEGAQLLGFELKTAPNQDHEWGEHEVQFLDVQTSKGVFQCANHNEHNGYYGGFHVVAAIR